MQHKNKNPARCYEPPPQTTPTKARYKGLNAYPPKGKHKYYRSAFPPSQYITEVFAMTTREQLLDHLLRMPEEKIIRAYNLLERFNWDVAAALEYLQTENEREETA